MQPNIKLIHEGNDTVITDGLTPADVRALHARGVTSLIGEGQDQQPTGGGGGEALPTDIEQDADPEGGQSPEDMAAELDEMEALDDADDARDWLDVDDDADIETDEAFEARYETLQDMEAEEATDLAERRRDRDELGESNGDHLASKVRRRFEEDNLAEDIAEAFRQFTSRDMFISADDGERLNMDNVVGLMAGDIAEEELYHRQEPFEIGDRVIGVSLDSSGSMDGDIVKALTGLAAFQAATDIIGDTFVANTYSCQEGWDEEGNDYFIDIDVDLITGPNEEFEWDHVNAVTADGGTPTSAGIHDIKQLMDECTAREQVLIVITDGKATHTAGLDGSDPSDSNSDAASEANALVRQYRRDGLKVIGIGIGGISSRRMTEIFDDDGWVTTTVDDLADTLIGIYSKQMRDNTGM